MTDDRVFSEKTAKHVVMVVCVLIMVTGAFAVGAGISPRSTVMVSTVSHYSAESYEWLWKCWLNETIIAPENPVIASLRIKCDSGVHVQLNISQNRGSHYVDAFNWTVLVVAWGIPAGDSGWYSIGAETSDVFYDPVLDNEPGYDDPFHYTYNPINSDYSCTNKFEIIVVMFGSMTDHIEDPWMHHEWYITTWRA